MIFRTGAIALALAAVFPYVGAGQRVTLRMQPQIGDTIHLVLDQEVEMRGAAHDAASTPTTTATLRVRARAIPTSVRDGTTLMTAITDSVSLGRGTAPIGFLESARRSLEGQRARVRVLADGSLELADTTGPADVAPLVASMPAILPARPVRVGESWAREMRLPVRSGRDRGASVRATFRLDSLSRDSVVAFISVRGAFHTNPPAGRGHRELQGTLTGVIEFNRALRWITASRTTITARSHVSAADKRRPPVDVWMTVRQRLNASVSR